MSVLASSIGGAASVVPECSDPSVRFDLAVIRAFPPPSSPSQDVILSIDLTSIASHRIAGLLNLDMHSRLGSQRGSTSFLCSSWASLCSLSAAGCGERASERRGHAVRPWEQRGQRGQRKLHSVAMIPSGEVDMASIVAAVISHLLSLCTHPP